MTLEGQKKAKNSPRTSRKDSVSISITDEKTPLLMPNKAESSSFAHQEFNGDSFSGAVFNLSTTTMGAGMIALPATMKVLGLGLGIAAIVFVAVLTEFSIGMLLRFSKAGGAVSYGGVMGDAFGDVGRKVLQVCVVINNIGVLVVYMIIIGDVLSGSSSSGVHHAGLLESWFGQHWWNGRFVVLVVTTLGVFTPLACFKRIVFLAFAFVVITAGVAVVKWLQGTTTTPRFLPDVTDINSIWALFTVVPVLVTAFVCHFNVHSIENELEDRSRIKSVVRTSLALCSIIYIMTSFFGILLFGDSTMDNVLSNFDADLGIPFSSQLNDAVRVSYAFHLMLGFPVIFHPLRLNLDGLLFPSFVPLATDKIRFSFLTIALISVIFLGANFIPSFWDAFHFTGATAAVCIGFIFPATITLRDCSSFGKGLGLKRKRTKQKTESNENNEAPEPDTETAEEKGGQNPSSTSNLGGKHGKQESQVSDPPNEGYIHVRARSSQAINSHSLAERLRREKIHERMKLLQDLVPGCSKVTGTAVLLDEIINYVQSLQRQVEFLQLKLAAVNPRLDFNMEGFLDNDILQSRDGLSSSLAFPPDITMPFPPLHSTQPGPNQAALQGTMRSSREALQRPIEAEADDLLVSSRLSKQLD